MALPKKPGSMCHRDMLAYLAADRGQLPKEPLHVIFPPSGLEDIFIEMIQLLVSDTLANDIFIDVVTDLAACMALLKKFISTSLSSMTS